MINSRTPTTDTSLLTFGISTRTVKYGDNRSFVDYRIVMRRGRKVVGVEDGPSRESKTRTEALKLARRRVRELRSHKLFIINVTEKHIKDGEGRDCRTCPIAQALWHNQERMGLPKHDWSFEVSTYAAFAGARGIVLLHEWGDEKDKAIPTESLPMLAMPSRRARTGFFTEEMIYWTMHFDDWDDAQYMSLKEWREARGYDDGERPFKPSPCSFVLDLDAFKRF